MWEKKLAEARGTVDVLFTAAQLAGSLILGITLYNQLQSTRDNNLVSTLNTQPTASLSDKMA